MKLAPQYEFTGAQREALRRARILEYLTIAYLVSVAALMYAVMGSSQAMKTAWIEDCLSLVPPVCFLIGSRVAWRPASGHFPYGYHRAVSVLHLLAAVALLVVGGLLLLEALLTLFRREHPTIGMREYFGQDLWLGWWMIAVLAWGVFPPVILGHLKLRHAATLNDKILVTDGEMNKADWMTAAAAIAGVLGIGAGLWWADAAAAAFISLDILKDGWKQTAGAVTALMNRAPQSVRGDYLDLPARAEALLRAQPWVRDARVRMAEHGHLVIGEGYVRVTPGHHVVAENIAALRRAVCDLDWRLHDFAVTVAHPGDGDDAGGDSAPVPSSTAAGKRM